MIHPATIERNKAIRTPVKEKLGSSNKTKKYFSKDNIFMVAEQFDIWTAFRKCFKTPKKIARNGAEAQEYFFQVYLRTEILIRSHWTASLPWEKHGRSGSIFGFLTFVFFLFFLPIFETSQLISAVKFICQETSYLVCTIYF